MDVNSLKFDMCCAARLLYRFGMSVGVAGHLSVTVAENTMLVNRFGPSFATLTPADILTMDYNGKVLDHDPSVNPYVNETIQLHGGIGMTWEHPAHLYLKRAKADELALGTPGRHRTRLSTLVNLP